jgi:vacuolar-type H+-ATPase subunit E/Vma4
MQHPDTIRASDQKATIVRHMQDEAHATRQALQARITEQIEEIENSCRQQREKQLKAGRAQFPAAQEALIHSVVAPAKREADAIVARQMGAAVERILLRCSERIDTYSRTEDFLRILEELILGSVACAQELNKDNGDQNELGCLLVSPRDVEQCRKIVVKHDLKLTVQEDSAVSGGVELILPGNKHRIRNTLATRMHRIESDLRAAAAASIQKAFEEDLVS